MITKELNTQDNAQWMYDFLKELFPICRSITGNGVRETLQKIKSYIPISIFEVASGTEVFDWTIPKEWNIEDGYIIKPDGTKLADFKENNLHIIGYSQPIDKEVNLSELQEHLYSLPDMANAIPYITSYYKERWGFCITHNERMQLVEGKYKVVIKSKLENGYLTYGELIIPGSSKKEIFLSTYICHPSMANNELSGPVVLTALAKWLLKKQNKYTYRIVFVPETIGSITYLSKNLTQMKENVIAGWNITCVGDDRTYSFLPSRNGNSLADRISLHILNHKIKEFKKYSFLDRGSDERQYCSPGVDLPVATIMRSKYGEYPEYHTSKDDLNLVTSQGLQGSFEILKNCFELAEKNVFYKINCLCEPQLGKRDLYPSLSTRETASIVKNMVNFITYADGSRDLIDICEKIGCSVYEVYEIIDNLKKHNLLIERTYA